MDLKSRQLNCRKVDLVLSIKSSPHKSPYKSNRDSVIEPVFNKLKVLYYKRILLRSDCFSESFLRLNVVRASECLDRQPSVTSAITGAQIR